MWWSWSGNSAVPLRGRRAVAPRAGCRDHQRSRVYRWEQSCVFPHHPERLSLDECRRLVEEAYRWLEPAASQRPGWRPPRVGDGRGRRHACGSREVIRLPRWARTAPIVLHECAHGVTPDKHGPFFVRVYVELLHRFLGMPREALLAGLAEARIAVAATPVAAVNESAAGGNGRGRPRKAGS